MDDIIIFIPELEKSLRRVLKPDQIPSEKQCTE